MALVAFLTYSGPQDRCYSVIKFALTSYAVLSTKVQDGMFSLVSLLPESNLNISHASMQTSLLSTVIGITA